MSQKANDAKEYYEYKIKSGDTLSMIIFRMLGCGISVGYS